MITLTNSAQILCGSLYLLWLLSVAPQQISHILDDRSVEKDETMGEYSAGSLTWNATSIVTALMATVAIVGLSHVIATHLWTGDYALSMIVVVTSLSIIASFFPVLQHNEISYAMGEYLLLVFAVAVGMASDFFTLMTDGGVYILYVASIFIMTIMIHIVACKICRIDRDTCIITSVSAIYGPVFIPQIAIVLHNRQLIAPGMACALVGLAIGTFFGLAVTSFLTWLL